MFRMHRWSLAFTLVLIGAVSPSPTPAYLDVSLSGDVRARDIVARLTLDEKVAQLGVHAPGIPRLGIPAYDWSNEALHGVAFNGIATVFPQAIGLAATWDPALLHAVAEATSLEARAKYEEALKAHGSTAMHEGLDFFSPNVNILRDPRWGRGQETYGEDPYLTAQMGIAFVTGMQGDHPRYFRTIATLKHFAAHSGPEDDRGSFNSRVSPHDLTDTYLAQFERIVRAAHPDSIMTSYNAIDGVPMSANKALIDTVRAGWGFDGYVVSDCEAIRNIYSDHHYASSPEEAAADALKAGVDLDCGRLYTTQLAQAVKDGLVTESQIDTSLTRLFVARMHLGMFDPAASVPYASVQPASIDSPAHRALARRAAEESLVLLRNRGNVLPLNLKRIRNLAVIGPTASHGGVLVGNYDGTPSQPVTILSGILSRARASGVNVTYAPGGFFKEAQSESDVPATDDAYLAQAIDAAKRADAVILVEGLNPNMEGENDDRDSIELPVAQDRLARAVVAVGKPVVLVLTAGSALAMPWEAAHVRAILYAWYPGEEGGTAVARVLFGDVDPAGRLPMTFYQSTAQLPAFDDYSMRGRTYRYFTGDPLYGFGYGLSYTTFRYSRLRVAESHPIAGHPLHVTIDVTNSGVRSGDDVVELYVAFPEALPETPRPIRSLVGLARIALLPHENKSVAFTIDARSLTLVDAAGSRIAVPGPVDIQAGGEQPDRTGRYPSPQDGLTTGILIHASS